MDSFEAIALAISGGAIVLVIAIVLVLPKLGGDPNRSVGGDSSGAAE